MIDTQSSVVESEGEAFDERHVRACTLRAGAYLRPSYATVLVRVRGSPPPECETWITAYPVPDLEHLECRTVAESPGLLH